MLEGYTLSNLEDRIGYRFTDISLLKQAVTHSSYTNEQKINKLKHYERLEFLGDAVLELISSDLLFKRDKEMPEGALTKLRASLVCEPSLASCGKELGLGNYMLLGKGEECTGGRERDSIIADMLEAVIGAIYLDGGIDKAREFINRFVLVDIDDKQLFYDSKSTLQELIQGKLKKDFCYKLLGEHGPEHDKVFEVEFYMEEECLGKGQGRTKKIAEQQAAYNALLLLRDKGYVFKKY